MAKFLPSELISAIRNKAGASVFSVNRGGAVVRAYQPVVGNPNTVYQQAQRAAVKSLMTRWVAVLSESQRIAWESVGKTTQRVDVLAQRYTLTGANHFMAVNLTLNSLGFGPVDDPPYSTYASDCGPLSLVADSVSQSLVLTARNGLAVGEVPFIRATRALSPGVNLLYSFLRVLPFPSSSPGQNVFDISSAWIARYGSLPQDKRVGVHMQYVNSTTGALGPVQPTSVVSSPQEVDALLSSRVVLSSADILGLYVAPKVLVPAPPAGQSIVPIAVWISLEYLTSPYTGGGGLLLVWGPLVAGAQHSLTDVYPFDSSADAVAGYELGGGAFIVFGTPGVDGQALSLGVTASPFVGGLGSAVVTLFYALAPSS